MKKIILLIAFAIINKSGSAQIELGFLPKIGYNFVDIEKSTGSPKYENSTGGYYLNDWDQLNYGGTIYGAFKTGYKIDFGGEITFNRLYYWEEAYATYYGPNYRWGNVNTLGLGILVKLNVTEFLYLKPVISVEYYMDGSGVNFGTALSGGINFNLSEHVAIPVEFRTDQIFGNAISFLFGLGTGLRICL
jgi:hypothetical protein